MDELWKKFIHWWNETPTQKRWTTIALIIGILCTLLFLVYSNFYQPDSMNSSSIGEELDDPFYYFGVAAKTVGVLLLIVGGAVILRRVQKKQIGVRSQRALVVMESSRLSPKQVLHMVRVGEEYFLVGATDQNISLISQVEPYKDTCDGDQPYPLGRQSFETVLEDAAGLENRD